MKDPETRKHGDTEKSIAHESAWLLVSPSSCLPQQRGAIILCGGRSTRMGRDKASLSFGPGETILGRVVRILREVVPAEKIVCVAALGQSLPPLPKEVRIVIDNIADAGPLAGLARGLASLARETEVVYAAGCDSPLLMPAFVERIFQLLGDGPIAAPHDGRHWHSLAAVYRPAVASVAQSLLAAGEHSLTALLNAVATRRVTLDELREVDPDLASLATCNTMDEYQSALRLAGLLSEIDAAATPSLSNASRRA